MRQLYPWLTDLHMDSMSLWQKYRFIRDIKRDNPSGLLLTGDITHAFWLSFDLYLLSKIGCPVYLTLGNHEFFGSSLKNTYDKVRRISEKHPNIVWLEEQEEPVKLDDEICVIGSGGWFDAGQGDARWLNWKFDWWSIKEFRQLGSFKERLKMSRQLAQESADKIERRLHRAIDLGYRTIYILTHWPPFLEATRDPGTTLEQFWLPYNTNIRLGKAIERVMETNRQSRAVVLSGHTHHPSYIRVTRNIDCQIGEGKYYGLPHSQKIYL